MVEFNQENSSRLGDEKDALSQEKSSSKKVFVLIGLISVVAIFFGFIKLLQNIKSPFTTTITLNKNTFLTNEQLEEINLLKSKDTDSDGLTDYEELYLYNTSPYLKDSDSDNFSDKEEVDTNNDPNCPKGADCTGISQTNTNTSQGINNTNQTTEANTNLSITEEELLSGDVSVETLRETLKNAGAPGYIIDSTDDETLLEIYNQTMSETVNSNTNTNTSQATNTNQTVSEDSSTDEVLESLKNLSAQEIRALLIENGVSESELEGVDDETLKAVFLKAIEEESQNL